MKKLQTFIGYVYVVDPSDHDPYYYELEATGQDEYLTSVDEFIENMRKYKPDLCQRLEASAVTDVLIMNGD